MSWVDFALSLLGLSPWYAALPIIVVLGALWLFNPFGIWVRAKIIQKPFSKAQLTQLTVLVVLVSFITSIPILIFNSKIQSDQKLKIGELENLLSRFTKGVSVINPEPTTGILVDNLDCQDWDYCTDFKSDLNLENKYYRHTEDDPQKLIL